VLTKPLLMERFGDVVTDRAVPRRPRRPRTRGQADDDHPPLGDLWASDQGPGVGDTGLTGASRVGVVQLGDRGDDLCHAGAEVQPVRVAGRLYVLVQDAVCGAPDRPPGQAAVAAFHHAGVGDRGGQPGDLPGQQGDGVQVGEQHVGLAAKATSWPRPRAASANASPRVSPP
jgi:hypothetical protein